MYEGLPYGHPDTFGDGQDEQGKIVNEISGSFDDLAEDIASAYSVLWDRYGPFTAEGVDEKARESLAKDPDSKGRFINEYDYENGLRALRNSRETVRYGQTEETMFKNKENYAQLELFEEEGLTTKEILDRWCLIQDGESNGLGFATGFLKEYDGYHSHK